MKILIDINHPAHVHLLRNAYKELVAHGHEVHVLVKDIPSAKFLLEKADIPYTDIGTKRDSLLMKGLDQLVYDWKIWKYVLKHGIEIGVGSSINLAHVSKVSRMDSIILDDDDDAVEPLFVKYAHPFCDSILSPNCITRKAIQTVGYPGYHDLAYLHPNRFTPDPSVLMDAGLKEGEKFFILRFNAFKAHHDVGAVGLNSENKHRLVSLLEKHGRVLITAERDIDPDFKPYQITISPEKIHSLMYYATMFIGDSQSMTSEAAVLGTPAIKCNSFAGRLAVPNEIEDRYDMCYCFLPENVDKMFEKIDQLLQADNLKAEWQKKVKRLLNEKIDVTAFITWFIENYPQSKQLTKSADADFWKQFV